MTQIAALDGSVSSLQTAVCFGQPLPVCNHISFIFLDTTSDQVCGVVKWHLWINLLWAS